MTALVYAYQHVTARMTFGDSYIVRLLDFPRINRKGIVTYVLLGIAILGALQYLGTLYKVFSLGLQMQAESRELRNLSLGVDMLELETQRASANFPVEHRDVLDSMEKISQVKYITGDGDSLSYVSSR